MPSPMRFSLLLPFLLLIFACQQAEPDSRPQALAEQTVSTLQSNPDSEPASLSWQQELSQSQSYWQPMLQSWPDWVDHQQPQLLLAFNTKLSDQERLVLPLEAIPSAAGLIGELIAGDLLALRWPQALSQGQDLRLRVDFSSLNQPDLLLNLQAQSQDWQWRIFGWQSTGEALFWQAQLQSRFLMSEQEVRQRIRNQGLQANQQLPMQLELQDQGWLVSIGPMQSQRAAQQWQLALQQADGAWQTQELLLPSQDRWQLLNWQRSSQEPGMLELTFNQPVNQRQQLHGLVRFDQQDRYAYSQDQRLLISLSDQQWQQGGTLWLSGSLRSQNGQRLGDDWQQLIPAAPSLPAVKLLTNGRILPSKDQALLAFAARQARSIQLTAFAIPEHNLPAFIKEGGLELNYDLTSQGRYLWRRQYELPEPAGEDWQSYQLDLSEFFAQSPSGLVRLELSLDLGNSSFSCQGDFGGQLRQPMNEEGHYQFDQPSPWQEFVWQERFNPCHPSYYLYQDQVRAGSYLLSSNLGLWAQRTEHNQWLILTTDLSKASALPASQVTLYNWQNQVLAQGQSDEQGWLKLQPQPGLGEVAYLIAQQGTDLNFLRLSPNTALAQQGFDVAGSQLQSGLQAMFFTERGLWRPGEQVHLSLILLDELQQWQPEQPVILELFTPSGQRYSRQVQRATGQHFYHFPIQLPKDAELGRWSVLASAGSANFRHSLQVDDLLPNRLQLGLSPTQDWLGEQEIRLEFSGQWLAGGPAQDLSAEVELFWQPITEPFVGFEGYHFADNSLQRSQETQGPWPLSLNEQGQAELRFKPKVMPQGLWQARALLRAFEPDGRANTSLQAFRWLPHQQWVGQRLQQLDQGALPLGQDAELMLVSLNPQGQTLANRELEVQLYRLDWRWWWQQSQEDLASFINQERQALVWQHTLRTDQQGRALLALPLADQEWGRYLVRSCDPLSKHCSAQLFYLGWFQGNQSPSAASHLLLASDQDSYDVGQQALIKVPASHQHWFYSLTNASDILEHGWISPEQQAQGLELELQALGSPTSYLHLYGLNSIEQTAAGEPVRSYGVLPLTVNHPEQRLEPIIDASAEQQGNSQWAINIRESQGRAMDYHLMLVDEGLLSLTQHRINNPYDHFYRKRALSVRTWDLFDQVLGARGRLLPRLQVGGSDAELANLVASLEAGYQPWVKILGTHHLAAGAEQQHLVEIDQFQGQLRLMLVAAHDQAFGAAEHSLLVSQPLSMQSNPSPRLALNEQLQLPLQIRWQGEQSTTAKLSWQANEALGLASGERELQLQPGRQMHYLSLDAKQLGTAELDIRVQAGDQEWRERVQFEVQYPLPEQTEIQAHLLAPDARLELSLQPWGLDSSWRAELWPAGQMDLDLAQLWQWQEQQSFGSLPHLTASTLMLANWPVAQEFARFDDQALSAQIERLNRHFNNQGFFTLWPQQGVLDAQADLITGWLLAELNQAESKRHLPAWQRQQVWRAQNFLGEQQASNLSLEAALRHWVLTQADLADLSAMNRLRQQLLPQLSQSTTAQQAALILALAYQQLNLAEAAQELAAASKGWNPAELDLESLHWRLAWQVQQPDNISELHPWASQTAHSLRQMNGQPPLAVALASRRLLEAQALLPQAIQLQLTQAQQTRLVTDSASLPLAAGLLELHNQGAEPLWLTIGQSAQPLLGEESEKAEGFELSWQLRDEQGQEVNLEQLRQGQILNLSARVRPVYARAEGVAQLQLSLPSGIQLLNDQANPWLSSQSTGQQLAYSLALDGQGQELHWRLQVSHAGQFYWPGWQLQQAQWPELALRTRGQWLNIQLAR